MVYPTEDFLKKLYKNRRKKLVDYLVSENLGAAVFIDNEAHREPAIRYFTGHTSDAVFIIFENGNSVLIPWDEILAKKQSFCEKLIPFTKYKNNDLLAVKTNLNNKTKIKNRKVEIPPSTSYPDFLQYIDALSDWDVRCKEDGIHNMQLN